MGQQRQSGHREGLCFWDWPFMDLSGHTYPVNLILLSSDATWRKVWGQREGDGLALCHLGPFLSCQNPDCPGARLVSLSGLSGLAYVLYTGWVSRQLQSWLTARCLWSPSFFFCVNYPAIPNFSMICRMIYYCTYFGMKTPLSSFKRKKIPPAHTKKPIMD